ncbi:DUF2637 domain-containing protein [Streptomyces sp. NPDC048484]|uniref:DUF2637 domain-containing protein n=1 Tax=Streptomyces sp. NPDC048484 TaxID=3155146 RepID=UPI003438D223
MQQREQPRTHNESTRHTARTGPAHRLLTVTIVVGAVVIAGIGFAGSYAAVRELALEKGFGNFSYVFPIGIDAGICVLLALDLLLTWTRIPFPLLRQTAWLLTAATIAFNAATTWPDPLGVAMHAVIPILFVVCVEAARHAIGRIADITADKHMEGIRLTRWLLSPLPTFLLWRRMKLWELRSYEQVIKLEQERLVYQARLRTRYGRGWRRKAPVESLMPLRLARYGVPLAKTAPSGLAAAGIEPALPPPAPRQQTEPQHVQAPSQAGPASMPPVEHQRRPTTKDHSAFDPPSYQEKANKPEPNASFTPPQPIHPYGYEPPHRATEPARQDKDPSAPTAQTTHTQPHEKVESQPHPARERPHEQQDTAPRTREHPAPAHPSTGTMHDARSPRTQQTERIQTPPEGLPPHRPNHPQPEAGTAPEGPTAPPPPNSRTFKAASRRTLNSQDEGTQNSVQSTKSPSLLTVDRYYQAWHTFRTQHGREPDGAALSASLAKQGILARDGQPIKVKSLVRYYLEFRLYTIWAEHRADSDTPELEQVAKELTREGITAQYHKPIRPADLEKYSTTFENRWQTLQHHTSSTKRKETMAEPHREGGQPASTSPLARSAERAALYRTRARIES